MPDDVYNRDALAWAKQQSALLRRLAEVERIASVIDWPNVIEAVEGVGRSELHVCSNLLRQALVHLVRLNLAPVNHRDFPRWRREVCGLLADVQTRFSPSMRQLIEMDDLYVRAGRQVRAECNGAPWSRSLPMPCPYVLDDFIDWDFNLEKLVAKLTAAT